MKPRQIVETYLNSFYREHKDFEVIESLLADDFTFSGPMATFDSRDSFMTFIREIGPQKNTIEIKRIIVERNDVAVFHDFSSLTPVIGPLPFAEWYSLKDGKIESLKLFFDAREFAELLERGSMDELRS